MCRALLALACLFLAVASTSLVCWRWRSPCVRLSARGVEKCYHYIIIFIGCSRMDVCGQRCVITASRQLCLLWHLYACCCLYVCPYVCVYVCMHAYIFMYVCMSVSVYMRMYVCLDVRCVCMCVCMHVCMQHWFI